MSAAIPLGIIGGLFLGEQVGVFGATLAAVRLGIAQWPSGVSTIQFYGAAILTGIGFTMSLFIGMLAFEDETVMAQVRLGVPVASASSASIAALVLLVAARARLREYSTGLEKRSTAL